MIAAGASSSVSRLARSRGSPSLHAAIIGGDGHEPSPTPRDARRPHPCPPRVERAGQARVGTALARHGLAQAAETGSRALPVKTLARALLSLMGWRLVGEAPRIRRCIVIFAPHTSNWDFPILLLVRSAFGVPVHYLAKHSLFRPPFGWFFRLTGGIPVVRHERRHVVSEAVRSFRERDELWLAISPEGTRHKTDHWKSGFYRIARAAEVPVLLAFLDAAKKECGLGELVELSGDVERDLGRLRAFYTTKRGIRPELTSAIRFKAR